MLWIFFCRGGLLFPFRICRYAGIYRKTETGRKCGLDAPSRFSNLEISHRNSRVSRTPRIFLLAFDSALFYGLLQASRQRNSFCRNPSLYAGMAGCLAAVCVFAFVRIGLFLSDDEWALEVGAVAVVCVVGIWASAFSPVCVADIPRLGLSGIL